MAEPHVWLKSVEILAGLLQEAQSTVLVVEEELQAWDESVKDGSGGAMSVHEKQRHACQLLCRASHFLYQVLGEFSAQHAAAVESIAEKETSIESVKASMKTFFFSQAEVLATELEHFQHVYEDEQQRSQHRLHILYGQLCLRRRHKIKSNCWSVWKNRVQWRGPCHTPPPSPSAAMMEERVETTVRKARLSGLRDADSPPNQHRAEAMRSAVCSECLNKSLEVEQLKAELHDSERRLHQQSQKYLTETHHLRRLFIEKQQRIQRCFYSFSAKMREVKQKTKLNSKVWTWLSGCCQNHQKKLYDTVMECVVRKSDWLSLCAKTLYSAQRPSRSTCSGVTARSPSDTHCQLQRCFWKWRFQTLQGKQRTEMAAFSSIPLESARVSEARQAPTRESGVRVPVANGLEVSVEWEEQADRLRICYNYQVWFGTVMMRQLSLFQRRVSEQVAERKTLASVCQQWESYCGEQSLRAQRATQRTRTSVCQCFMNQVNRTQLQAFFQRWKLRSCLSTTSLFFDRKISLMQLEWCERYEMLYQFLIHRTNMTQECLTDCAQKQKEEHQSLIKYLLQQKKVNELHDAVRVKKLVQSQMQTCFLRWENAFWRKRCYHLRLVEHVRNCRIEYLALFASSKEMKLIFVLESAFLLLSAEQKRRKTEFLKHKAEIVQCEIQTRELRTTLSSVEEYSERVINELRNQVSFGRESLHERDTHIPFIVTTARDFAISASNQYFQHAKMSAEIFTSAVTHLPMCRWLSSRQLLRRQRVPHEKTLPPLQRSGHAVQPFSILRMWESVGVTWCPANDAELFPLHLCEKLFKGLMCRSFWAMRVWDAKEAYLNAAANRPHSSGAALPTRDAFTQWPTESKRFHRARAVATQFPENTSVHLTVKSFKQQIRDGDASLCPRCARLLDHELEASRRIYSSCLHQLERACSVIIGQRNALCRALSLQLLQEEECSRLRIEGEAAEAMCDICCSAFKRAHSHSQQQLAVFHHAAHASCRKLETESELWKCKYFSLREEISYESFYRNRWARRHVVETERALSAVEVTQFQHASWARRYQVHSVTVFRQATCLSAWIHVRHQMETEMLERKISWFAACVSAVLERRLYFHRSAALLLLQWHSDQMETALALRSASINAFHGLQIQRREATMPAQRHTFSTSKDSKCSVAVQTNREYDPEETLLVASRFLEFNSELSFHQVQSTERLRTVEKWVAGLSHLERQTSELCRLIAASEQDGA